MFPFNRNIVLYTYCYVLITLYIIFSLVIITVTIHIINILHPVSILLFNRFIIILFTSFYSDKILCKKDEPKT